MSGGAWPSVRPTAPPSTVFVHPSKGRSKLLRGGLSSNRSVINGGKSAHLLQKLTCRETFGVVRNNFNPRGPQVKPFTRLPGRLAFCLKDAIHLSAIEAGHIFLGFSKCGQFLLSYTQTAGDNLDMAGDFLRIPYHYRLHWWLFVPYKRAKKVAEVMLFTNAGADGNLHLSVCQWPKDEQKVLVFGYQKPKGDSSPAGNTSPLAVPCYVTVTAVPSLNGCKACVNVAASYEEDELAAAWNSCARLSCLEHGMTVHTLFDLVPPYPKFEPKISMKRDSCVVVNSGNLLHCLHFHLEKNSKKADDYFQQPPHIRPYSQQLLLASPVHHSGLFSPPHYSPSVTSDSDATDCESDYGGPGGLPKRRRSRRSVLTTDRMDRVAEFAEQLSPPQFRPTAAVVAWHGIRRMANKSSTDSADSTAGQCEDTSRRRKMAEKAYELTDDDFDNEGVQEKLSTFRRKRLAEKKYEFTDEDSENIMPLPKLRNQLPKSTVAQNQEADQPLAGPSNTPDDKVLRPLHSNQSETREELDQLCLADADFSGMIDSIPVPELLSPGGMVKKDQSMASPRSDYSQQHQQPPPREQVRFHAKFTRRFVEMDEEAVSVMTDVEDDDLGATTTGYHSALPLEVHGAAYQPMAMISNAKAEQLNGRCVRVQQHSLDVELLCYDMAQKLCHAAGKKYWFCNDYDVEIVDLDPVSGEVICVAVVLVMATVVTKKVSQGQKYSYSSLQRHLYQGGFKFCWNVDSGSCYVVDSDPLTEMYKEPHGVWHPARNISTALQKAWGVLGPQSSNIRCFTNDSVIRGTSLKTIVDQEHLVAIILDDLD